MVDGFGRFADADYRRSWLMFDEVSYALPPQLRGVLDYPRDIVDRIEFCVTRGPFDAASGAQVAENALRDAGNPEFLELVARTPSSDAAIAGGAVMSDGEAHDLLKLSSPPTEALALAFLLNKLLYLSQNWGLVPIVGKGYAADMVAWKARKARSSRAKELPGRPTQRNATRANCAAFAAGLSFGFVDDTDLVAAPLEALARFKQENLSLLHRSQSYIEGVASKFSRLLDHDRLADEIELLRQEACEERAKLDEEARRGLISAGIQIAGKALAAGVSAFAGGVILTSHSGPAAIAGTVSALAAAAPDTFDLLRRLKDRHGTDLAYLFRLGDTLSLEAAVGLPPR